MGLLGRKTVGMLVGVLAFGIVFPMTVRAEGRFAPLQDKPEGDLEDYIVLCGEETEYEVLPGDCLWNISEELWGDGERYMELFDANASIIDNPDMVFPGMLLTMPEAVYLKKESGSTGMSISGAYRFDKPKEYTVGYLNEGEVWSNLALHGDKMQVVCLVRDKRSEAEESMADWEACRQTIQDYIKENYENSVSDLTFEKYQSQDGGEVYLYSFLYSIDLSLYGRSGRLGVNVCIGIKMTEHIQAEFTGFGFGEEVTDVVRYITASMEEAASYDGDGSVNANNMSLSPSVMWELEGIHNPFPWIEQYYDAVSKKIFGIEEEKGANRKLLDNMQHPQKN